jgi:AAA+ superfamily predicted ATPase
VLACFQQKKIVLHNKVECIWCQMDGFDQTVNVKVIMATNRADTLDPALLHPGRLDSKVEFPLPDQRQKRIIFQVCFLTPSVLKFSFTCHFHCYGHYLDASQKNVKFLIGV